MDGKISIRAASGENGPFLAKNFNPRHETDATHAAGESMSFREVQKEQKEKTSQALIEAALDLAEEQGYASLSLRSVARKAGIAPTSFYRHFREMDELGLAIADQGAEKLLDWMDRFRQSRRAAPVKPPKDPAGRPILISSLVKPFVETFLDCLDQNSLLLRLFFQERTGSVRTLRASISKVTDSLTNSLTDELVRFGRESGACSGQLCRLAAETLMTLAVSCGMDVLTGRQRAEAMERAVNMSELVLLGVWEKGG